ncbi:hypothetical protein [Janthinobacterium sp. 17J80-10]|uniref:hypothetical protein n=1 Tax=Janthinobacterium sp. 17J80-10 TaxID=2497863 RepID=UPI00100545F4|nr:hypothetical protein [Janthinobacterium sp. 17J80-10]QAU33081.1 hypothetical protein EKL02_02215 [Janthinobacterium sp. 17J80-10]
MQISIKRRQVSSYSEQMGFLSIIILFWIIYFTPKSIGQLLMTHQLAYPKFKDISVNYAADFQIVPGRDGRWWQRNRRNGHAIRLEYGIKSGPLGINLTLAQTGSSKHLPDPITFIISQNASCTN